MSLPTYFSLVGIYVDLLYLFYKSLLKVHMPCKGKDTFFLSHCHFIHSDYIYQLPYFKFVTGNAAETIGAQAQTIGAQLH